MGGVSSRKKPKISKYCFASVRPVSKTAAKPAFLGLAAALALAARFAFGRNSQRFGARGQTRLARPRFREAAAKGRTQPERQGPNGSSSLLKFYLALDACRDCVVRILQFQAHPKSPAGGVDDMIDHTDGRRI
jgi:hypothetical protein